MTVSSSFLISPVFFGFCKTAILPVLPPVPTFSAYLWPSSLSVTETGDVSTQTWTDYSQKENTTEEIVTGGDDERDEIIEQVLLQ